MTTAAPAIPKKLAELLQQPEGERLEWKRSTGELRDAMQTICAFLNGGGGTLLFGIRPDGRPEGQQVTDQTIRDLAEAFARIEPPWHAPIERFPLGNGREILALHVERGQQLVPFTYDGRAYQRVGSTTRRMPKDEYDDLVLERMHSRRRWENQPADEISFKDIDRDELFRFLQFARSSGRLTGPVGRSTVEMLARLGLHKDGHFLRAAVVLFGKTFLPDYPQCELRMARFRGTDKTEFLDERSLRGPAFKLLDEAELFCRRHFPMPARIVPGQMRRVEKPLIPVVAMREILVNAFVHRDYSIAGGAVSLALFDDRVEVWSAGTFPRGITPEMLSQNHLSVQRNPILAEVFFRGGFIERWGRGTNRVIDECVAHGITAPTFEEITGGAVVTFRVPLGSTVPGSGKAGAQPESRLESRLESQLESLDRRVLIALLPGPLGKREISLRIGQKVVSGQLHKVLRELVAQKLVDYTLPAKPNSRLQQYRLTRRGRAQAGRGREGAGE
ncbi:MAG: putative DNA binding domain-containing protein [Planctomycetes bacterium]|nr:putative DNA binding domain-containing protein [Planctomycetota bacterium]